MSEKTIDNTVEVRRVAGNTFVAKGDSNHWVVMDAKESVHGHDAGARPVELLLMALGGCSGVDVELMLRKMRVEVDDFRITLDGYREAEPPRYFTDIEMTYHFWGKGLPLAKLERAVQLSEEKYCSVTHTLNGKTRITSKIEIHS